MIDGVTSGLQVKCGHCQLPIFGFIVGQPPCNVGVMACLFLFQVVS